MSVSHPVDEYVPFPFISRRHRPAAQHRKFLHEQIRVPNSCNALENPVFYPELFFHLYSRKLHASADDDIKFGISRILQVFYSSSPEGQSRHTFYAAVESRKIGYHNRPETKRLYHLSELGKIRGSQVRACQHIDLPLFQMRLFILADRCNNGLNGLGVAGLQPACIIWRGDMNDSGFAFFSYHLKGAADIISFYL